MKYGEILDCQKTIFALFDQGISSGATLAAIYDILKKVDNEADKYTCVYNSILRTYGVEDINEAGRFQFIDENRAICEKELEDWKNTLVPLEQKKSIPMFFPLSPRQYGYLLEFVEFIQE